MSPHDSLFVALILTAGSFFINIPSANAVSWAIVALDAECDASADEVLLQIFERTSLTNCQQSCAGTDKCKTITYYFEGLCKHFSTSCTDLKRTDGDTSLSLRLVSGSSTDRPAATGMMTPALTTIKKSYHGHHSKLNHHANHDLHNSSDDYAN